jgi:hypothetical protein
MVSRLPVNSEILENTFIHTSSGDQFGPPVGTIPNLNPEVSNIAHDPMHGDGEPAQVSVEPLSGHIAGSNQSHLLNPENGFDERASTANLGSRELDPVRQDLPLALEREDQSDGPEPDEGRYFPPSMVHAQVAAEIIPPDFISASRTLHMFATRVPTTLIEERCFPIDQQSEERDGKRYCRLRRSITSRGQIRWGPEEDVCNIPVKTFDSLRRHYHSKHMACPRTIKKKDEDWDPGDSMEESEETGDGEVKKRKLKERTRKQSRRRFYSVPIVETG